MKCQNCGYENPEGSKFCTSCGKELKKETIDIVTQEVQKPKQKENKKKLIIVVSIIVVLSLCITAFFLLKPASVSAEYKEAIQTGQKYLDAQEYEKAEDAFLLAQSIEPKISEPYVKLYEVYKKTDQPKKMKVIKQEVETQLPEKEQEIFEDQKEEIDNKMEDTAYTVLDTKVPDFEITPIDNISYEGYTVKVDGKYGFIDSNAKYVMDAKNEAILMTGKQMVYPASNNLDVCMFPSEKKTDVTSGRNIRGDKCGYGFGGAGIGTYLTKDHKMITAELGSDKIIYPTSIEDTLIMYAFKNDVNNFEEFTDEANYLDDRQYYIVISNNQIYGPYDAKEKTTFVYSDNTEKDEVNVITGLFNEIVMGPFYEKTEEGYRIWNEDGTKSTTTLFDKATPISDNAMKVEKNGKMGVIDADLELVLFGDFEDVTLPINNKAFVKMDGKWKQIQIKDESGSNENIFKKMSENYIFSSGAGGWGSELVLKDDGSYQGRYYDTDMGSTGSGYSKGTMYQAEVKGKFSEPKAIDEYSYSLKVETMKLKDKEGSEYIENEVLHINSEFSGFNKNDELVIYVKGTPLSKLPESCMKWIENTYLYDYNGDTLPGYIIYNKALETVFFEIDN